MKPYLHAKASARRYGGTPEAFLPIHQFMDSSKAHLADCRHRALLHHSFGCFIAEQVFGVNIDNGEGKLVSVRDIAEDHCKEDLGFIPSVQDYFGAHTEVDDGALKLQPWMGGRRSKRRVISIAD